MIGSFKGRFAEVIAGGRAPKGFPGDLLRPAQRRLAALIAANELMSLASPPGNRLEALRGDRAGQHSIRINDQWRICFRWVNGQAEEVEIVDYHQ
jgi:proteic killer suppression protein